jgi:hypothetical protein
VDLDDSVQLVRVHRAQFVPSDDHSLVVIIRYVGSVHVHQLLESGFAAFAYDPDLPCDRDGGYRMVARDHDDLYTSGATFVNGFAHEWPRRVQQAHEANESVALCREVVVFWIRRVELVIGTELFSWRLRAIAKER